LSVCSQAMLAYIGGLLARVVAAAI
jgi:hypothetical protein